MSFSERLINAVNAEYTEESFFYLLTITGTESIYLVNNNEPLTSNGQEFTPYPFSIILQNDSDDKVPTLKLVIDNTDLALIELIRALEEAPTFKIELVLGSTPDTIEKTIDFLKMKTVSYDKSSIQADLVSDTILFRSFPKGKYNPIQFPGLFF